MNGQPNPDAPRFAKLFTGYPDAYGTGRGQWVHEPVKLRHYSAHLAGMGDGLGIGPLRPDGTVMFAAIDVDEPDFDLARDLAGMLPGPSWIERSRSGNAHVWVFFKAPIEAWVPRGILREAVRAAGRPKIEVFPKQDRLREGSPGNYINLPYFGDTRPIIKGDEDVSLPAFLDAAFEQANDPAAWIKRAGWLMIEPPEQREKAHSEFGTRPTLHRCAEWVLEHRDENPIVAGHRNVVYFSLAKQFAHCEMFDHDEALDMLMLINDASPDPINRGEMEMILRRAEEGQFTSTGCDDPLFAPYAHPDCPIANDRRYP